MKVIRIGDKARVQLKDTVTNKMLVDFWVDKKVYKELRQHMLDSLNERTYEAVFEAKEFTAADYKAAEESK